MRLDQLESTGGIFTTLERKDTWGFSCCQTGTIILGKVMKAALRASRIIPHGFLHFIIFISQFL